MKKLIFLLSLLMEVVIYSCATEQEGAGGYERAVWQLSQWPSLIAGRKISLLLLFQKELNISFVGSKPDD